MAASDDAPSARAPEPEDLAHISGALNDAGLAIRTRNTYRPQDAIGRAFLEALLRERHPGRRQSSPDTALRYNMTPRGPISFIGVALFLTVIAFTASYLTARRATTVDPIVALWNE